MDKAKKELISKLSDLTILYAEDDQNARVAVSGYLELLFKELFIAENGEKAYGIYQERHPDIILTDIDMPKLNGIELIKKIREDDTSTPVIIMTAHSKTEYLLNAIDLDVTKYIIKPFDGDKFLEGLAKIFNSKNPNIIQITEELKYDIKEKNILKNDEPLHLSKKESKFFELLVKHCNELVTFSEIENFVWDDYDDIMTSQSLRTLVSSVRKKVPKELIVNVPGFGYKLICNQ